MTTENASLPASVRKQMESAQALHEQAYSTPDEQSGHADSQAEQAAQESAQPPQTQAEDRDALYWQQRFNVLQGKYNSEVPQLQQQIRDLQAQLQNQQDSASQSGKAAEIAGQLENQLTEEELEILGPELAGTIRKMIAASAPAASDDLNQLKSKVESFEQEATEHKQALFWSEVNAAVPDWQQMQSTPEAQQWLTGIDQLSGQVRNDLLNQAAQSLNAHQVIQIFKEMQVATAGRQIPSEKIQPDNSRAASHNGEGGKLWSRAEINRFYKDKTQGRYSDDQAQAIEADIFAAQSDGRIVA